MAAFFEAALKEFVLCRLGAGLHPKGSLRRRHSDDRPLLWPPSFYRGFSTEPTCDCAGHPGRGDVGPVDFSSAMDCHIDSLFGQASNCS
ncbi:MAG: hypothetical protein NTY38_19085 [Acidobacteria bacterium]|nr:hypothetical protein [Acidobacteriota bacterium]